MLRSRRANAEDIPQLLRLEQDAPTAAHWTLAQYELVLCGESPQRLVLVADGPNAGVIFGFLVASRVADEWEIENLVVGGRWRRNHVAEGLVRAFLGELSSTASRSILLEVRESNLAARRLYEKIGFTADGRRNGYYQAPDEDCILYRLSLQPGDKIP